MDDVDHRATIIKTAQTGRLTVQNAERLLGFLQLHSLTRSESTWKHRCADLRALGLPMPTMPAHRFLD